MCKSFFNPFTFNFGNHIYRYSKIEEKQKKVRPVKGELKIFKYQAVTQLQPQIPLL